MGEALRQTRHQGVSHLRTSSASVSRRTQSRTGSSPGQPSLGATLAMHSRPWCLETWLVTVPVVGVKQQTSLSTSVIVISKLFESVKPPNFYVFVSFLCLFCFMSNLLKRKCANHNYSLTVFTLLPERGLFVLECKEWQR